MEPCITDNRSHHQSPATGDFIESLNLLSGPSLQCLIVWPSHCTGTVNFVFSSEAPPFLILNNSILCSDGKGLFNVHPSRIYDFILTRCWAAHAVLCQAFSGNHSSKSFHNNENKNTFPPELSIFASEARRHGGRVKIIYHTPATHSAPCVC